MSASRFLRSILPWLCVAGISLLAPLIYLLAAGLQGVGGFALDDAWIHQTFARNFAATGQFAFVPGQLSSGSTSPLWTLLIALGYLAHADYKSWTYALGIAGLALTALGVWQLSLQWFPDHPRAAFAAGVSCALEWHLAWAAVSGMETVLFTALAVWLLVAAAHPKSEFRNQLFIGLLSGLLVLTRPEGLLLVGAMSLAQAGTKGWMRRTTWTSLGWEIAGMAILIAPWLAFNWRVSGTPFPNTFYAKQREYAALLETMPLARRAAQVFFAPLIGAQVLLAPGVIVAAGSLARRAADPVRWQKLASLAWVIVHLGLYTLRLPAAYQHGRYEMPAIPILIVLGVGGSAALLRRALSDARFAPRVLSRATVIAIAVAQLGFVALGARAYATDVSIIEGEMVSVARWLDANTAPGDLIAAHDIGAIGYFARRPLLDLAGLISPEVIPFIRDQTRLWALVQRRSAAYLVTFPSWYPDMMREPGLVPVFAGSAPASPEHLTAYRLSP